MKKHDVILKAENISKQYRLGLVGTGTLSHDLNRWWHRVRGKDDPYLKIGDSNDRSTKSESDYVWALQDINFEVRRGEVLGIIGKNGAGKSTLLKILSKVTSPTTGIIKTKGRIASLLEVGTGFHPEMTGRENIYLNGAILGMTKAEINDKIEEIIDFSGCARYIDTPVKRYSSGMTVRLAFAVAAHLEPEILVVDEVLAVGDAEFQKKAIGKMQDISKTGGRTVLFVSHNMAAVKSLCTRALVLEKGKLSFNGGVNEAINKYLNIFNANQGQLNFPIKNNEIEIKDFFIEDIENNKVTTLILGASYSLNIHLNNLNRDMDLNIRFQIFDENEVIYTTLNTYLSDDVLKSKTGQDVVFSCIIDKLPYAPGQYKLAVEIFDLRRRHIVYTNDTFYVFQIVNGDFYGTGKLPKPKRIGKILTDYKWKISINDISQA